jgi:glutathione S-transferase
LQNKPAEFVAKYREASGGFGSGLVPLLEDGDNLLIESDVVAKYVAQNIDGKDGKGDSLYPSSAHDDKLIQSFVINWEHATDTYYDVLRATSQKEVEKCQNKFIKSLAVVEKQLQEREGAFVLGHEFTYAECISAPWIQRFFVTMPYFRGIDFQSDVLSQFKYTSQWMNAVCARPSCVESRCPEDEMIAACKKYYVSYISPGARGSLR